MMRMRKSPGVGSLGIDPPIRPSARSRGPLQSERGKEYKECDCEFQFLDVVSAHDIVSVSKFWVVMFMHLKGARRL